MCALWHTQVLCSTQARGGEKDTKGDTAFSSLLGEKGTERAKRAPAEESILPLVLRGLTI